MRREFDWFYVWAPLALLAALAVGSCPLIAFLLAIGVI